MIWSVWTDLCSQERSLRESPILDAIIETKWARRKNVEPVLGSSETYTQIRCSFADADCLALHKPLYIVPLVSQSRNWCMPLTTLDLGCGLTHFSRLC